ncbi:HD domain-containing protein, partial [Patescibacteria group bacterium]|nr:HD domain-containing protein [Patescibacteria group bacterium]
FVNMKTKVDLTKYEQLYDTLDKGHDFRHIEEVRTFAEELAKVYCPQKLEVVYIAATLHDVGLSLGRENHEIVGAKLIEDSKLLTEHYTVEDANEIYEAIREHRASSGNPQSIVAKIVSDADKVAAGTNRVFQRAYEWGLKNLPQLNQPGQLVRAAYHLKEKFGGNGTGNRLYFEESRQKQNQTYEPIFAALKVYDFDALAKFLL